MANVLSDDKRHQVEALGRLGWTLRRIQRETGVRRETASEYLRAAGIPVRGRGGSPPKPATSEPVITDPERSKPATSAEVITDPDGSKPATSEPVIVIALRVPPEDVRELYHTWLVGLWAGELQRKEPALPARYTDQDAIRRVTPVQLAELLGALPAKQPTRISFARVLGEFVIPDGPEAAAGFVEYRNLSELGGFDVSGPIALADIMARVGGGEYRVSAYGFDPRGLRWEVFVRLSEDPP